MAKHSPLRAQAQTYCRIPDHEDGPDCRVVVAVDVVSRLPEIRQQVYAISVERRLKHPAVVAICEAASADLLA